MASPEINSTWLFSNVESFSGSFNIQIEEGHYADNFSMLEVSTTSTYQNQYSIPKPPPLPAGKNRSKCYNPVKPWENCCIPKETKDTWEKLFKQGYGADVHITTKDEGIIPAHFSVLIAASPVMKTLLSRSKVKNGIRHMKVHGVPYGAVYAFIRFMYSACYDEGDMKMFALHLLVLSHSYMVPSLKRVCINFLEQDLLTTENVIDVLQLARNCDASHLSYFCLRMISRDFKTISSTEGWKIMRRSDPALEQELLEIVVEADSRKQERLKKLEEQKVYLQLHEAMEALVHICRDGCRTIGPRDKVLKVSQAACNFPSCKGIETLVRHFSCCKARVPGGCVQCKRMWQLLELHSSMCVEPDYCRVPLCRHLKEKMQHGSKKDETKWKLLVNKVLAAKNALAIPRRIGAYEDLSKSNLQS